MKIRVVRQSNNLSIWAMFLFSISDDARIHSGMTKLGLGDGGKSLLLGSAGITFLPLCLDISDQQIQSLLSQNTVLTLFTRPKDDETIMEIGQHIANGACFAS